MSDGPIPVQVGITIPTGQPCAPDSVVCHGAAWRQDLRRCTTHAVGTSIGGILAEVGCASGCAT
jgi:hypothetical protein